MESNRRSARLVHKVGRYTITPKILYCVYSVLPSPFRYSDFLFFLLIYLPYLSFED